MFACKQAKSILHQALLGCHCIYTCSATVGVTGGLEGCSTVTTEVTLRATARLKGLLCIRFLVGLVSKLAFSQRLKMPSTNLRGLSDLQQLGCQESILLLEPGMS